MQNVYNMYVKSLEALLECPEQVENEQDEQRFASVLQEQLRDHSEVTRYLQLAHRSLSVTSFHDANINGFLDKLFLTRNRESCFSATLFAFEGE